MALQAGVLRLREQVQPSPGDLKGPDSVSLLNFQSQNSFVYCGSDVMLLWLLLCLYLLKSQQGLPSALVSPEWLCGRMAAVTERLTHAPLAPISPATGTIIGRQEHSLGI